MPIECALKFRIIDQDHFHAIDKIVMKHSFAVHNTLGRFCDERIYQEELSQRCCDNGWKGNDQAGTCLKNMIESILNDLGAYLNLELYREALLHLLDDAESGLKPVDLYVNSRAVGRQNMCILDPSTAWHLSAIRTHFISYETHIRRLLNHTILEQIHWINFNHNHISLKTIHK